MVDILLWRQVIGQTWQRDRATSRPSQANWHGPVESVRTVTTRVGTRNDVTRRSAGRAWEMTGDERASGSEVETKVCRRVEDKRKREEQDLLTSQII